jgi:anthraniloyl-CoA monooxygenase
VKITVLGAGPAGLYCGLLLKKADPAREVTIVERNPPDATYGWGVVFSDRTLASFHEADYQTYRQITDHFVLWDAIDIHYRDQLLRCGGHIFAGLARKLLLAILQERCRELGVALRFNTEAPAIEALPAADLVIAADGVNSLARKQFAAAFQPSLVEGKARYIWFGTDRAFDAFTFLFRANEHGFFQVHAYPFSGETSTFIVECTDETWRRAGLDRVSEAESIAYCEQLFARDLGGCRLLGNNSKWVSFVTVSCAHWHNGNLVLLGDAAHTAHFSIGSGTKLAMEDAIALAHALDQYADLETALTEFELERKPIVETLQAAARESQSYFERVSRTAHLDPEQFSFHLLTRSGRVSYDDLRLRDPGYVARVDRWFAAHAGAERAQPAPLLAPPPLFLPLRLRGFTCANRAALLTDTASLSAPAPSTPIQRLTQALTARADAGVGLLLSEPLAVSPEGRVSPATPVLREEADADVAALRQALRLLHRQTPTKVGATLVHAGRRGATQPRAAGLDRPLRAGTEAWPLVSASALPYTAHSQTPGALDRAGMDRVREEFVRAARLAAEAGFDLLQLHLGHGYLLATFLSPLANIRSDEYGGTLENRLRFPLEVFAAVRAVWPAARPLAVALTITDSVRGGMSIEEGITAARALKALGCDLIQPLAGYTVPNTEMPYGRGFLTPLADRVRNEAGVAALVSGYLTTANEANTILASGRGDLCLLSLPA